MTWPTSAGARWVARILLVQWLKPRAGHHTRCGGRERKNIRREPGIKCNRGCCLLALERRIIDRRDAYQQRLRCRRGRALAVAWRRLSDDETAGYRARADELLRQFYQRQQNLPAETPAVSITD